MKKNKLTKDEKPLDIIREINPHKEAFFISMFYGVLGILWILFSGELIYIITEDLPTIKVIELYKGWIYVVVTVFIMYLIIKKRLNLSKEITCQIREAYQKLNVTHSALIETEQRFELAVVGSKDGIWDWNLQNNTLIFSSSDKTIVKAKFSFGDWKKNIHPNDCEKAYDTLRHYLDEGTGVYQDSYRIKEPSGNYIWLFSRGQAIWDEQGRAIRIAGSYTDITDQIQLQDAFKASKQLSDNLFDTAHVIIVLSDLNGKVIKCNKYTAHITGYSEEELIGSLWIDKFIPDEHKHNMEALLLKHNQGELVTNFEEVLVCKNGQRITLLWENAFMYKDNNTIEGILSIGVNITHLKEIENKLHYMAYHDTRTGLPNRDWAEEKIKQLLDDNNPPIDKFAMICLDIDNFKYINDTLGHHSGDKLIQYVSTLLQDSFKSPNSIVHINGDLFVILLFDTFSEEDVISRVKQIQKILEDPCILNEQEFYISTSMGIALYPEHGQDFEALFKNADTSMHYTKGQRKGGYSIYTELLSDQVIEFNYLENELIKAIKKKEFTLHYQPLVDFQQGTITGVEALIRWHHPQKGWIPPSKFIPIAESSGLILDLGKWIFDNACKQKKVWNDKGFKDIKMSINISNQELIKKELCSEIQQIIEHYNLDYSNIQIEITETTAMMNLDTSLNILNQLRTLGLKIALDDFGTGYSSLNYLKTLPIDSIKLDRSFIKGILDKNQEEEIIDTVIKLGHILNLEIVAEGIETEEQLTFLKNHRCDIGQGYLFSKPMHPKDVESLLQSNINYFH